MLATRLGEGGGDDTLKLSSIQSVHNCVLRMVHRYGLGHVSAGVCVCGCSCFKILYISYVHSACVLY